MAIERRHCRNHPDRLAIGVCVITRIPICGECSTRYEGVNYSHEGMRILQERRAAGKNPSKARVVYILLLLSSPAMLWLMYLSYYSSIDGLIKLIHGRF